MYSFAPLSRYLLSYNSSFKHGLRHVCVDLTSYTQEFPSLGKIRIHPPDCPKVQFEIFRFVILLLFFWLSISRYLRSVYQNLYRFFQYTVGGLGQ